MVILALLMLFLLPVAIANAFLVVEFVVKALFFVVSWALAFALLAVGGLAFLGALLS